MELTKERAKENLSKLIEKFERELAAGRIKEYNEEATKISFIQPLLENVLGWNIRNHDEVSPEEKISRGRVDYGLKIGGMIKVFIEAKPIKADLNKHIEQAVRYGYNKKSVPFVLLTDFEGLKLFDVTVKPDSRNPLKGLKIDLKCNQYLQQFEKLWLFSKGSVIKGELDKLLLVKPKDRLPVDKAILDDLKRWRMTLAKDIFRNNHHLFHPGDPEKGANYLKEITQRILDRIIFMRSCEDRGFIYRRHLKELFEERTETVGTNTMLFLREEFKHYNIIFNSDLFRPREWENNLAIDFKVMKDIVWETYNPYQFDVIPLEVLGNIYEQYLGYTARLTDHQVKYELKPDVRKAGGVYYTPEYIVDYIVKNTISKLLEKLSPKKIKKLRILDPACGSGSFLIRAYEEISDYYRNEKKKHQPKSKEEQRKLDLPPEEAEPRLTIYEKSAILRDHIFGVDIDEQAVEVTKLSLMLKMLEGEYGIIPGRAVLPMLDRNIRCGNSLISGDTLELKKYFGDDWYKVKPFNWDEEFRNIVVKEGGFDVVIGNPPYVSYYSRQSMGDRNLLKLVTYWKSHYSFIIDKEKLGRFNSLMFFLERGLSNLKRDGLLGFLVDASIYSNPSIPIRKFILENYSVDEIVTGFKAFLDVGSGQVILIVREKKVKNNQISWKTIKDNEFINIGHTLQKFYLKYPYSLLPPENQEVKSIIQKLESYKFFSDIIGKNQIRTCITFTGKKDMFVIDKPASNNHYPLVEGSQGVPSPYSMILWSKFVNYDERLRDKLNREYETLARKQGKRTPMVIGLGDKVAFMSPKLFVRLSDVRITATYTNKKVCADLSLYIVTLPNKKEIWNKYSLKYFLGLINSRIITFFCLKKGFIRNIGVGTPQVRLKDLRTIPICTIDFSNPSQKKLHDDLVALVDVMLDLNRKIQTAKGSEKDQLQRQIEKMDREIDDLVNKLYGITEDERKIIEGTE